MTECNSDQSFREYLRKNIIKFVLEIFVRLLPLLPLGFFQEIFLGLLTELHSEFSQYFLLGLLPEDSSGIRQSCSRDLLRRYFRDFYWTSSWNFFRSSTRYSFTLASNAQIFYCNFGETIGDVPLIGLRMAVKSFENIYEKAQKDHRILETKLQ